MYEETQKEDREREQIDKLLGPLSEGGEMPESFAQLSPVKKLAYALCVKKAKEMIETG